MRSSLRWVYLWAFAGVFLCASGAQGAPVQWATNGHYYEVQDAGTVISWTNARAAAAAQSWLDLQGHLATITSAAENAFVRGLLPAQTFTFPTVWIGGYQPPGSDEPAGGWSWVTGEPWVYTNWSLNEPGNSAPGEGFLEIYAHQGDWWGMWNDNQDLSSYNNTKYVVEYEIPEPLTMLLAVTGIAALSIHFRRR